MDDPTEVMIRKEIAAARKILREDRLLAGLGKLIPPEDPPGDPDAPPPPPKKDPVDPPVKKGIWWGDPV